jgi:hypothetical protein
MADSFSVAEILDVVREDIHPIPAVVVGGQAVNLWATVYLNRVREELAPLMPLVSKDLDLYGDKRILENLAKKFGVEPAYSEPRTPGIGYVLIPREKGSLKVELLRSVHGLRKIESFQVVRLAIGGADVRVLDAISCLRAKIANAADLDQTNRQDVQQVKIMTVCAREYVKDLLATASRRERGERLVVEALQGLSDTITGETARRACAKHQLSLAQVPQLQRPYC